MADEEFANDIEEGDAALMDVNVDIVDLLGQRIKTLTSGYQNSGRSTIGWDATDDFGKIVPGGIYFYRLSVGDVVKTKKMLLLK